MQCSCSHDLGKTSSTVRGFFSPLQPPSVGELYPEDVDGRPWRTRTRPAVSGIFAERFQRWSKVVCPLAWKVARLEAHQHSWRIATATCVRCPAATAAHLSHFG